MARVATARQCLQLDFGRQHHDAVRRHVEKFRRLRADNYDLLKDQPEQAYARTGRYTNGTVSLLDLLRIFAEHAEKHVQQIHSARAAFKEFKAAQAAP